MMNNDSALQLSNVLNQNVPVASALPEQEACSGNHQRTGRQTVKFAAAGGVRSDPHPRKKWAVPGSAMVSPFPTENWKRIRCVLSAFLSSWKPPSPSTRSTINLSTCCSRCWCRPTRQKTHLHTLSPGGQTAGGQSDLSSPAHGAER